MGVRLRVDGIFGPVPRVIKQVGGNDGSSKCRVPRALQQEVSDECMETSTGRGLAADIVSSEGQ